MQNLFCPCRVTSGYHTALNWENGMWGTHAVIVTLSYICSFFYGALYWATHARNLLIIQCPWRCTYNFNVCSSWNDWESDFLLTAKKKKKKVQGWNVRSGWKMLRLWTCGFQGAGRASRWRFLAVSWKHMTDCRSWLQKWKLKSFSEKFKLWFDRNHTVSKRENTQDHSPVEHRPQGGREKENQGGAVMAFGERFSGQ